MVKPRRRVPGWVGVALAVPVVASIAAVARAMGASWAQIVWGTLGCLASALAASFVQ